MNRRNFLRGVLATAALSLYGPKAVASPKPETLAVEPANEWWNGGFAELTSQEIMISPDVLIVGPKAYDEMESHGILPALSPYYRIAVLPHERPS